SVPYVDLTTKSKTPYGSEKAAAVLGTTQNDIFYIGGIQQNMTTLDYKTTNNSIYVYKLDAQE
ncbi:196_t:CDS:1, partial [Scutellospora calospora]